MRNNLQLSSILPLIWSSDDVCSGTSLLMFTVQILCIGTDRSQQTLQTKFKLLLKKQSDQGLRCLPFHQHLLDALMQCYIKFFILGQLWQLFEVSQILEFLLYDHYGISGYKLKILKVLVDQFLTYAATRDSIEDNFEKLRQTKMDLKQLQWGEQRREREEAAARWVFVLMATKRRETCNTFQCQGQQTVLYVRFSGLALFCYHVQTLFEQVLYCRCQ